MTSTFDLDSHRSMPLEDWRVFVATLSEKFFLSGTAEIKVNGAAMGELWVVCNESISSLYDTSLLQTNAEILQSAFGQKISVRLAFVGYSEGEFFTKENSNDGSCVFANMLEFSKNIHSDDYVVFLGPFAEIEVHLFTKLVERAVYEFAGFVLFDLWFVEDGRAYPVLVGDVDPVAIDYCDYIFSTFIIRGDVVMKALSGAPSFLNAWELAKRVLGRLADLNSFSTLYFQIPLVRDNSISSKLLLEKERLISLDYEMQRRYQEPALRGRSEVGGRVAAIICTKDKSHLLSQLVRRLAINQEVAEIVIVSNNPTNRYSKEALQSLSVIDKVSIVQYSSEFNFSEQCNLGVSKVNSPRLLFLNDDIVPINPNWLEAMNDVLDRFSFVSAVGSLLLYPNETVQHGGMYLGFNNCAGHEFRSAILPDDGYLYRCLAPRSVSCVTGAVMLVERKVFEALNGFDRKLATYLQDVDLCLRINGLGKRVVFTPFSKLFHMESVSLNNEINTSDKILEKRGLEHQVFSRRWSVKEDGFRSNLFDVQSEGGYRMIV